jgi:cleavage and polyadenylation specificity factor subunit 1
VIDLTVGASASVSGDTIERTELIAACGHGKNGALAVLQRGIQPELVTEVESGTLPGLKGTWTVHHDSADNERLRGSAAAAAAQAVDPYHAYLVISLASSTMILETGEELKEVSEHVELVTDAATLCAGNAFGRERIVQVYDKGVRVAAGPVKVQDIASTELVADAGDGEGIEIVAAEISFPYVLCRLSDGSLAVLKGDEESKTLVKLDVDALARLPPGGGIACATLVDDSTPAAAHGGLHDRSPGFLKRATTATATTTTTTASASREDGDDDDDSRRPMFLAVTRTGGALELYSLPSCDKAWTANGLSEGVAVLSPAGSASAALVDRDAAAAADAGADRAPEIVELRVDAFARAHERPLLTALRADGAVLVYRAFTCAVAGPGGRALTQLRFARVPVELEGGGGGAVDLSALPGSRLTRFERVGDRGGIRGVFVSGPQPLWLLARRSRVLALPVRGEAQRVVSFTAFHNVNCHAGFILGTAAGGVRICQIPGRMHYEAAWPVRKLALRCTPHHVQYLPDFKLYALSTSAPAKWVEPEVAEEDIHAATVVKTRRAKAMARGGVEEQFAVKLLVPGSLETAWSRTMDPGEHVQAVKNVQVRTRVFHPSLGFNI